MSATVDADTVPSAFRERASFALPSAPGAVPEARHRIAKTVRGRLRRETLTRVELLVSEVVTNAIRHGGGSLEVVLTLYDDRVRIEIADAGPGFIPIPREKAPEDQGGWGLYLVEQLSISWGVSTGPRTRVWFELPAQPTGTT